MKKKTTAETVAALFADDGRNFSKSASGKDLPTTCRDFGAWVESKPHTTDVQRFVFDDGSAIAIAGDGWDIEGAEPFSWAGC